MVGRVHEIEGYVKCDTTAEGTYCSIEEVRVASYFAELGAHMISYASRTITRKLTWITIFINRVFPSFFPVRPADEDEMR
jgi:hypothetical protein